MTPLHRHQIAWLSRDGWQRLLMRDWDTEARACLQHWATQGFPVVVTRQLDDASGLSLGLCAPLRWQRRRIALQVALGDVMFFDEFPRLDQVITQLPAGARESARRLAQALQACGTTARVYGSHGWQSLTGLNHLREGSDLDVWMAVADAEQADAAVAALAAFTAQPRLDGELVFPGDAAVSWREWQSWREGRTRAVLVRRLHGAFTATTREWIEGAEVAEVAA